MQKILYNASRVHSETHHDRNFLIKSSTSHQILPLTPFFLLACLSSHPLWLIYPLPCIHHPVYTVPSSLSLKLCPQPPPLLTIYLDLSSTTLPFSSDFSVLTRLPLFTGMRKNKTLCRCVQPEIKIPIAYQHSLTFS